MLYFNTTFLQFNLLLITKEVIQPKMIIMIFPEIHVVAVEIVAEVPSIPVK